MLNYLIISLLGATNETDSFGASFELPHFNAENAHAYVGLLNEDLNTSLKDDADGLFLLAQLNSQMGKKATAIQLGLQARYLNHNDSGILLFVIKLLVREDRLEEVQALFKQLTETQKQKPEVLVQWGLVEERLGDIDKALEIYTQAVRLSSDDALSQMLLGKALLKQGETASALTHLEAACGLDGQQANAYYALSRAQLKIGDNASAIQSLKRYRRLKSVEMSKADQVNADRDHDKELRHLIASFHTELGADFVRKGQLPEAEVHLKRATTVATDFPKGFDYLVNYYLQKRELKEAKFVLEQLVSLVPDNADHHVNLGTVSIQLRDARQAQISFEKALALSPEHPFALANLSRLYLGRGREFPKALDMCLQLVQLDGNAANHDLLAWAYYANGKLKDAIAASSKSLALDPRNPGFRQRNQKLLQLKGSK